MSNREWKIDSRLLDPNNGQLKACFDFGSRKMLGDGKLRFELIIKTELGDFSLRGIRYDPDTDQLLLPSFRAGKGWQPLVKLDGPIIDGLKDKAKQLISELLPYEQPQEVTS